MAEWRSELHQPLSLKRKHLKLHELHNIHNLNLKSVLVIHKHNHNLKYLDHKRKQFLSRGKRNLKFGTTSIIKKMKMVATATPQWQFATIAR